MKKLSILTLLALFAATLTQQGAVRAEDTKDDNWGQVKTITSEWTHITAGSTTGYELKDDYYYVSEDLTFTNTISGDGQGSGMYVQSGRTVTLYIPAGVTLTVKGADASGTTGAGAGILLPEGSTLNIFGEGTIVATGGNAANGGNGGNGTAASFVSPNYYAGLGGAGGNGGGGAGAGIGTAGGNGGNGAAQLAEEDASRPKANTEEWNGELSGLIGTNGTDGATAAAVGTVNIASTITQTIAGGAKGVGGAAGLHGGYICYGDEDVYSFSADGDSQIDLPALDTSTLKAVAGGGGGGGGAGGGSAQAIGTGGAGGGGGASGACGSGRAEESWLNDHWTYVGAGGGAGGIGTEGNDGAKGYTCYFQGDDAEFDEEDNHKPGGEGGSAGAASATKTAGTTANPTYTVNYHVHDGVNLSMTSQTYTFGSGANITLPSITSTDGKNYKWMLSKYGRAFGETTSHCAGPNGDIYEPGTEVNLSNIYGNIEFCPVYISCQIDCSSQTESTLTPFDPDKYAVVNLKNRKLYKDGYWNTLTLPFSLSAEKLATTCLAGAEIRRFKEASWDAGNERLTINFFDSNEGKIDAGVPYIIRWGTPETATGEVIENPSFTNVEVEITSQEDIDDEYYEREKTSNGLRFEAQIGPVRLTSGSNALVFGSENKLYKPNKNVWVYPTRAYFSHTFDIASAREFVLDFGEGEQTTTYIDNITVEDNRESQVEGIFNLNGQRLDAPQKGINIINSRKVVIK